MLPLYIEVLHYEIKNKKQLRNIPEKNTWGRQPIYFSIGGWCGHISNYMHHWCLTKSYFMCGWSWSV